MNIQITHTITFAPEVLTFLQSFLGKAQLPIAPAPVSAPAPKSEPKPTTKAQEKETSKAEAVKEEASIAEPVKEEAPVTTSGEKYTVEQVREFAQQKILAGKLAEVKEVLTSFEAKSITTLDEKHYTAFVTKVKAL